MEVFGRVSGTVNGGNTVVLNDNFPPVARFILRTYHLSLAHLKIPPDNLLHQLPQPFLHG
jgi:hypothetical protein